MTGSKHLSLAATRSSLPPIWPTSLLPEIRQLHATNNLAVVVLDDDPTGTQTVYDVPVLTEWSVASLAAELEKGTPLFFVLTNSRGVTAGQADQIARAIGKNLIQAAFIANRPFEIISRSDSTLRGHFPLEVDALAGAIGLNHCPRVIIPFFLEGGRFTVDDEHYVAEGDNLVPASETPFAQDRVFGFKHSNLKEWVAEKTNNRVLADSVTSFSISELRLLGPAFVTEKMMKLTAGSVAIVNALEMRDLEVFTAGALAASQSGGQFLFRTAASFVQVRAGLATKALLSKTEMLHQAGAKNDSRSGGLIVVGSHVPKTSRQLARLQLDFPDLVSVEISTERLIDAAQRTPEITAAIQRINDATRDGQDVVAFTSRDLITSSTDEGNLEISKLVSSALVEIVTGLIKPPRFLIAKGGITSSDIATTALAVRRAIVMGQLIPGVPVWRLDQTSKFPGLTYVVFPGNVGDDGALSVAYSRVSG